MVPRVVSHMERVGEELGSRLVGESTVETVKVEVLVVDEPIGLLQDGLVELKVLKLGWHLGLADWLMEEG